MTGALGVELLDHDISHEIRLVADLMVAAGESSTALSQTVIDGILLAG